MFMLFIILFIKPSWVTFFFLANILTDTKTNTHKHNRVQYLKSSYLHGHKVKMLQKALVLTARVKGLAWKQDL